MTFSDFIVYADESGSPVLGADANDFPIFVLVFLIVRKSHYCDFLVPAIQRLKFDFVGHDQLILHERDIRRQAGSFSFLQVSRDIRDRFLSQISDIIATSDVRIVYAVIDKAALSARYRDPFDPYDLALTFCMERTARFLRDGGKGERNTRVNVVFEARGRKEDQHLELEFRRITDGEVRVGRAHGSVSLFDWTPLFIDKRANSTGLQVADLAARPLGLHYLRPTQTNRSADIIMKKVWDKKVFP